MVDRDRALYFFVEHEQLVTASPDEDRVRWDTAGSPPQFTVGDSQLERDWTFLETGYQYSSVGFTWRRGQYHLVRVHALLVLGVTGLVSALGIREVIRIRHLRRRAAAGCCLVCGYDMRGGQEVCPECGTAKGERRVRLGEGTTRVS